MERDPIDRAVIPAIPDYLLQFVSAHDSTLPEFPACVARKTHLSVYRRIEISRLLLDGLRVPRIRSADVQTKRFRCSVTDRSEYRRMRQMRTGDADFVVNRNSDYLECMN